MRCKLKGFPSVQRKYGQFRQGHICTDMNVAINRDEVACCGKFSLRSGPLRCDDSRHRHSNFVGIERAAEGTRRRGVGPSTKVPPARRIILRSENVNKFNCVRGPVCFGGNSSGYLRPQRIVPPLSLSQAHADTVAQGVHDFAKLLASLIIRSRRP